MLKKLRWLDVPEKSLVCDNNGVYHWRRSIEDDFEIHNGIFYARSWYDHDMLSDTKREVRVVHYNLDDDDKDMVLSLIDQDLKSYA